MVSIIVPVYNVEKYIGKALESVFGQTYRDIEVLIVDDCGNDGSMAVVSNLTQITQIAQISPEIKVLRHERNRGLSAARNTALEVAKGEWVYFFDSDDILVPDCIETLMKLAKANPEAEMIVGQYDEFEEDSLCHSARFQQKDGVYSYDVIGEYLEGKIPTTAWNKLVKKEFLIKNNLWFKEGLVHEDLLWSFQTFCIAKKVVVSDSITYHYLQRQGSLDKLNSLESHSIHFNNVYNLQAKFVFKYFLQNDKRLFDYIEKSRYQLLTNSSMYNRKLGFTLYSETRKYPYWYQLHRVLPSWLGYILYIRVRCWYLKIRGL